ncbi:hypothetical protein CCACVL1_19239 [Corchorus capsularis]|uniref:Uncharacterized protein n=1 Tax=Corchorus capsularis TaxID=210143 RepID=A0A1R3HHN5_COCAP|nr:hypothetical protein CCACVL1_19239 [Corchorus capsularis]
MECRTGVGVKSDKVSEADGRQH